MAKIFSILTLLAAGLALYLGLESGKRIKEMQAAGEKNKQTLTRTEGELTKAKDTLKTTEEKLATTTAELESNRAELATAKQDAAKAKSDLAAATAENDKTKTELAAINAKIKELFPDQPIEEGIKAITAKITELTDKVKMAEQKAADLEKERASLDATVKTLEVTKKEADDRIAQQTTTIKRYTDNIMQKGVRGRVMAVNSGWGFAVLSVGDRQGAAANKIMIVTRNGQGIGKVRITNVEATQSVADILPGTFIRGMYVQPGDGVIYTGDDKVKPEEAAPANSNPPATPAAPSGPTPIPALPQP
jgi:hypothetical protein